MGSLKDKWVTENLPPPYKDLIVEVETANSGFGIAVKLALNYRLVDETRVAPGAGSALYGVQVIGWRDIRVEVRVQNDRVMSTYELYLNGEFHSMHKMRL